MPTAETLDRIVAEIWVNVREKNVFASQALAETFKRPGRLSELEREEIVRCVYGVLQHDRRLATVLEATGKPPPQGARGGQARLWAWRILEDDATVKQAAGACPGIAWEKLAGADRALSERPSRVERLALRHSLPDFIAQRLIDEYEFDAEKLAEALAERADLTLRVNALKAAREDLLADLKEARVPAQPTPYAKHGVEVLRWFDVFATPYFQQGLVELQDEASQLVAELAAPAPRTLVVDYCAGAGGKTLALGALMNNRGKLVALDASRARLAELRKRVRRAGLDTVQALEIPSDPQAAWPAELTRMKGKAARVLVDAPCTGLGALRRKPEARWRLEEEDLERLTAKQVALARKAMDLVLPNGRLIYATCSVLSDENEKVVRKLLQNPAFTLVPLKEILGGRLADQVSDRSGNFLKLLPHKHHTDGFFAAVLRRKKA
ncbi:MAG: SAM-dependent methyltransferase [Planctomycetota bacterium]|nr:SAM-dependent methyltransferase [Planctomycetota bacterium]